MVPSELTLKNFMCYRGEVPSLKFEGVHVACLSGENGAGKSALLDAITWALWGKARMSDDELVAQNESDMLVELVFLLNQQRYRVIRRRQISRRGKRATSKPGLDLQIYDEHGWRPIGGATISETERTIQELLRMKYETFINSSFLIQGRADEFTRKTAGERKQVLADILDLYEYAQLEEKAKAESKDRQEKLHGLDGVIEHLQREADKLPLYEQLQSDAETKVATCTTDVQSAEQAKAKADEEVRELETKLQRRKELATRLKELDNDLAQREREIADLEASIAEATSLLARQDEIAAGMADLQAAQQQQEHLDSLRPRYEELAEQRRQLQDALKDEKRTLQSELEGWKREVQRIEKELAKRSSIGQKLSECEQQIATLTPLVDEQKQLVARRDELDERISTINTLLRKQSELATTILQQHDALGAEQKQHERDKKRLEKQLHERDTWQADLDMALQQQQQAQQLAEELATLRQQDQVMAERIGELRADCTRFNQQANDIKKRREMLQETTTSTCPLCRSDLGDEGVAAISENYETEIQDLREQYRTAKKDADAQEKALKQVRQQITQQETTLADVQQGAARVATLQQQLAQADAWQEELQHCTTALAEIAQRLETHDYAREAQEALLTLCDDLRNVGATEEPTKSTARQQKTTAPSSVMMQWSTSELDQQRKQLHKQQQNLEKQLKSQPKLESELATLRHQLNELDKIAETLPEAEAAVAQREQTIAENDFAHDIRTQGRAVEAEIKELGYSYESYNEARTRVLSLQHWSEESQRLQLAQGTLERDRRSLKSEQELLARYQTDKSHVLEEDGKLAQETAGYTSAQQQARRYANELTECNHELDVARNDLSEKRTLCNRAKDAEQQLGEKRNERQKIAERLGVFQELAEAFGKKGVQAMLIETAIPEIEREANHLLGRITGNQMHLKFDTQRSTKKGDTVETLEIRIADVLGTRNYDAFSGGEAMRINFAIRVALSRLLAKRAGASLETLVVDEGFGALDSDGRERFVEAITSIQDDFKCILVVTHIDELKDRFPTQIQVVKRTDGSTWDIV